MSGQLRRFDPTEFGFVLLQDFHFPGADDVSVFEFNNHPVVNGTRDFLRLNIYLTKDEDYVTIWNGLLETIFTETEFQNGRMASVKVPEDFDFASYNESLFRGYIDSREAAEHILRALRIGKDYPQWAPQVLHAGVDQTLSCGLLGEPA
jgi:hypothetical protein